MAGGNGTQTKKCRLFFTFLIWKLCHYPTGEGKRSVKSINVQFILSLHCSLQKVSPQTRFLSKQNLNANTNKITKTFNYYVPYLRVQEKEQACGTKHTHDDRTPYQTCWRKRGTKFIRFELSVGFGSCVQGEVDHQIHQKRRSSKKHLRDKNTARLVDNSI